MTYSSLTKSAINRRNSKNGVLFITQGAYSAKI